MDHLGDVTADELRSAVNDVTDATAAKRLSAAIAYKHGTSQTELAEWFGVERRTIYAWLTRLDGDSLAASASDEPRSGRPAKLDPAERDRLAETLRDPPTVAGYDAGSWTPTLVRRHVRETFGIEYSRPSCRRLLADAGLQYVESRPSSDAGAGNVDDEKSVAVGDTADADRYDGGVWKPR